MNDIAISIPAHHQTLLLKPWNCMTYIGQDGEFITGGDFGQSDKPCGLPAAGLVT
jgi:hypothetical protein